MWIALAAMLAGAPPHGFVPHIEGGGDATIDAWSILVKIDRDGAPSVDGLQRRLHYPGEIAPCASPANLRDVHSAAFPEPRRWSGDWTITDVVVTAMNARGRATCARVYAVVIDAPHNARQYPLGFGAHIPLAEGAAAITISGWRGMPERTYSIAELRRRFGR